MRSPTVANLRSPSTGARAAAVTRFLLALSIVCPHVCGCGGKVRTLPDDPAALWYRLAQASPSAGAPEYFDVADLLGDGHDEEIKIVAPPAAGYYHVTVSEIREGSQHVLKSEMHLRPTGICGSSDLSGDGREEIVRWQQTDDARIRVDVLSLDADRVPAVLDTLGTVYAWDVAGALLPNGSWSGTAELAGSIDSDGDGVDEQLVVAIEAGLRGYPRGLWLLNWKAGRVEWGIETAAAPTGGSFLTDIDGDGELEIIVGLASRGNRIRVDRWDDSHSYVVALALDGTVLWSHELAGASSIPSVAVGDLDSDGEPEIVTSVGGTTENDTTRYRLSVRRAADGVVVDGLFLGGSVNDIAVGRTPRGARIFAASNDGTVRLVRFAGGELAQECALDCGSAVHRIEWVSFAPTLTEEALLLLTSGGAIGVVDAELRPMAVLSTGDYTTRQLASLKPASLTAGDARVSGALVRTGEALHYLRLVRRPLPVLWKALLAAAAVIGVLAAVPRLRRHVVALLRRTIARAPGRAEEVDGLLSMLAKAGHGKLKATRTFRRLRDQLAMLSAPEVGPPEAFEARFVQAVADAREFGVPTVRQIAEKAQELGLAPDAAQGLIQDLEGLGKIVYSLVGPPPADTIADALRRQLDAMLPSISNALTAIRLEAQRERSSSLGRELARVLATWRGEAARHGVALDAPDAGRFVGTHVFGTTQEIVFVLDNLLDNAVRAVEGCDDPRVVMSVQLEATEAVVTVADNGRGIPPERHKEIFEKGVTEKAKGGRGLPESKGILKDRDGSIKLVRSAPGEGSVFEVRLVICG